MKLIKYIIICIFVLSCSYAFADTTQSRDGEGNKMQGGAFKTIRSASIGTKGFKCFSTSQYIAFAIKITETTSIDGSPLGFKLFYNNDESTTFPISDSFAQWMNAPVSKVPTITSICMRGYSTAKEKTASGLFQ